MFLTVLKKKPSTVIKSSVLFLQQNVACRSLCFEENKIHIHVHEFLAKNSIIKMDHPHYSLELAPLRFLAVSKIKKCPEGIKIC
jgi:uncharacterized Zn-finger protein